MLIWLNSQFFTTQIKININFVVFTAKYWQTALKQTMNWLKYQREHLTSLTWKFQVYYTVQCQIFHLLKLRRYERLLLVWKKRNCMSHCFSHFNQKSTRRRSVIRLYKVTECILHRHPNSEKFNTSERLTTTSRLYRKGLGNFFQNIVNDPKNTGKTSNFSPNIIINLT